MNFLRRLDAYLLFPALCISGLSIFILLSTANNLFLPQLINIIIGLFFYSLFNSIDHRIWIKYKNLFYIVSIFLLTVIFFLPKVRGAHRWIDFGIFILQPSEILKPVIILYYSAIISRIKKIDLPFFIWQLIKFLPVLVLIFLQPDLGNVIIYISFFIGLLIIGGINTIHLISGLVLFVLSLPAFWSLLKEYQKQRIFSFINPKIDPGGAGYNAIQSMIAVGSGGIFGMGLGRGSQSRLLFLPEYQTDFIFASLVESLGLVGGVLLLILYLIILIRILVVALKCEEIFGRIVSVGIFCQILFQVLINIGMNIGILPITGITLPLLSYGGSSIVSTFICLGLVNSISQAIPKKLLVIR